ncbi:unnamed protein product [Adineta steineri]|uniref:N-acetyltransferase domain-containing protein n=2 Tax=Adineta steineri TaxID=433720 RepID=A0A815AZ69_9BILA|nr:unnamed protein product [Adineta steineri]
MAHIEKNYMNSPGSHWWVAVLNDHIVGQVAIQPLRIGDPECYHETSPEERDDACELRHMVVAQNAQEYGVGSRLMLTFLTFAKEHRYHQVHLSTMTHMNTACQFYEKHDYQRGIIKRYPVHNVENKEWVRFESIETMPKEDQQWMKLPLTISPYRYRQHYWRKV